MNLQNLITLTLTDEQLARIDAAVNTLETEMGAFIALPAEVLRRLRRMGDKSESFCRQALQVVSQNPQMIPPNIPVTDALADLKVLDQLRPRLGRLTRLCERGNHTDIALGHDILTVALQAYGLLKLTGRAEGMEALRRDLAGLFAKSKPESKKGRVKSPEAGGNSGQPEA